MITAAVLSILTPNQSFAASAAEIDRGVDNALAELYAESPNASKVEAAEPGVSKGAGYRETAHVKKYYELARH